jgi:predicted dehydrogenase
VKISLLGFGAIAKKRLEALRRLQSEGLQIEEISAYDPFISKDKRDISLVWHDSIESVIESQPTWVFIATPHNISIPLAKRIIPLGCKILIEKPFGRTLEEVQELYDSMLFPDQIYVGFNYRFFEGVAALIGDVNSSKFGDIISINMGLNHGGSPKDAFSWKSDAKQVGSGALLDPGIHLLDLLQFITYNVKPIAGKEWRGFWNTNISEEVHLLLEDDGCIVDFQSSLVRWLSDFHVRVNGTDGYGEVRGKSGGYGNQQYVRGERWSWCGSDKTQRESEELVLTSDCSNSFHDELDALLNGNYNKYVLYPCCAYEALKAMKLYDRCLRILN